MAEKPGDTLADTQPYVPPAEVPPAGQLVVHAAGATDPGRIRDNNEDHFLVAELGRTLRVRQTSLPQEPTQYAERGAHVLLVADGMGGHAAGEVASGLSVATVERFILNLLRRFTNLRADDESGVLADLGEAVRRAEARIMEEAEHHPEFAGMGTTLTLAFVSGRRLFVLHAGDSRAYLVRGGHLTPLTEDHTVTAELVRQGELRPEDARRHRFRHVVTNVLGGHQAGVQVDVRRAELRGGDTLLLCTDGLTDLVDDAGIAAVLADEPDETAACRRLVAAANDAGGRDNVTVVVARFADG